MHTPPLGSGARFNKLTNDLAARGATDPEALAAAIGRRKYGAKRFDQLARHHRRRVVPLPAGATGSQVARALSKATKR